MGNMTGALRVSSGAALSTHQVCAEADEPEQDRVGDPPFDPAAAERILWSPVLQRLESEDRRKKGGDAEDDGEVAERAVDHLARHDRGSGATEEARHCEQRVPSLDVPREDPDADESDAEDRHRDDEALAIGAVGEEP